MRRLLAPRWIAFHIAVVAVIVAMVNLGFWQLRRLDERRDFNAVVAARITEPPAAVDELVAPEADLGDDALANVEWRSVTATGEYVTGQDVLAYNRSQGGQAGDHVITPLQLDDGRVLLVVRGFVPLGTDAAAPPDGVVEVTGRLRQSEGDRRRPVTEASGGEVTEIRSIDIARLAPQLPGEVVPMYVELISSTPAEAGPYPVRVLEPELGERNHLSYAVQWFLFSTLVAVGWGLAVRKHLRQVRAVTSSA